MSFALHDVGCLGTIPYLMQTSCLQCPLFGIKRRCRKVSLLHGNGEILEHFSHKLNEPVEGGGEGK